VLATSVSTDVFFSTRSNVMNPFALKRISQISNWEMWHGGRSWQDFGTFLKGDFNGDGKADLAYAWNNAGQIQIDVALGFQSGERLSDWVRWFSPGTIPWFTGTGGASWQTVAAFQTGDFDGQGKMDISYAYLGRNAWTYVNLSNSLGNPLLPDLMTDV